MAIKKENFSSTVMKFNTIFTQEYSNILDLLSKNLGVSHISLFVRNALKCANNMTHPLIL